MRVLQFGYSIYKEAKHNKSTQQFISSVPSECQAGHYFTTYKGKQAIVTDGILYLFHHKVKGAHSPWHS